MNQFNLHAITPKDSAPKGLLQGGLITRARNPFWLAPMAGVTDVCYRQLMDEMGAGVLISELISAKGLLYKSGKTRKMLAIHPRPGTLVGVQLFGEAAEDIIEASQYAKEAGAAFIDINLGCPVKKVIKKGCGAALMRDPANLETYLTRIKRGIDLPLTVKMRTGWSHEELTIHECVKAAYNAGCEWAAVHGRTRAQKYEGIADWDLITQVKQRAKIPIIGNGDIRSAKQARSLLVKSGVDAVMIGRGALRNPWIFQECLEHHENAPVEPYALLGRYLELLRSQYDLHNTHILLRKFAAWLVFGYPGAAAFRGAIYRLLTVDELMQSAGDFFSKVAHLPRPQFGYSEVFMTSGHG